MHKNIALIYRNYEKKPSKSLIVKIRNYCKKRKIKFYLSNNYKMAINLHLDGVYLPSFNKEIRFNIFSKRKNFLILGSAHSINEISIKQKQGCKLIFLAPIFKVNKKKHFLGINKFNQLVANKKILFVALGGINDLNIKKINLLSNNPVKRAGLLGYGLEISRNTKIEIEPNTFNKKYLETKRDKMGHDILKK